MSFRILSCSWPRPVECDDARWLWTSPVDWSAPPMPVLPSFARAELEGAAVAQIDWRAFFRRAIRNEVSGASGEMKRFHVVFRLRCERSGTLVFFDDDGCVIRRDGEIVHEDRRAHAPQRHQLEVRAGDELEIAQWQFYGEWSWAARLEERAPSLEDDVALFAPFRADVERALRHPNGPVLKTFFAANAPVRAALAMYSAILNGYRPAGLQIYGDYQWSAEGRRAIEALLPFAEIVPTAPLVERLRGIDPRLVPLTRSHWAAMKLSVSLFHPPYEFGWVDDDVFTLDRMDDALAHFRDHDFVFQSDMDHGADYQRVWSLDRAVPNINNGLCFMRNRPEAVPAQARWLVSNPPNGDPLWMWEQGFVAGLYAQANVKALPSNRYLFPLVDGLPEGLQYDWRANPCEFATVHFAGMPKPDDAASRPLVRDILSRRRAV